MIGITNASGGNGGGGDVEELKETLGIVELPSGYRQLSFIESHGLESIRHYMPNPLTITTFRAVMEARFMSLNKQDVGYYDKKCSHFGVYNGMFSVDGGYDVQPADTDKHIFDVVCNFDDTSITLTVDNNLSASRTGRTVPMEFWSCCGYNDGTTSAVPPHLRIYSVKYYHDNVLVRNMIPAMRESDSAVGLYDFDGNAFYTNDREGAFGYEKVLSLPETAEQINNVRNSVLQNKLIQLVQNGNFMSSEGWTKGGYSTMTMTNGECHLIANDVNATMYRAVNMVVGHRYLLSADIKFVSGTAIRAQVYSNNAYGTLITTPSANYVKSSVLFTCISSTGNFGIDNTGRAVEAYVKNAMLIDLTATYGSGNEPATLEEFLSDFPNDYYSFEGALWENASPSSSFAAQTVSVDLSMHKKVLVVCKETTTNNYYTTDIVLTNGNPYRTSMNDGSYYYYRDATATATGIVFANGYRSGSSGGNYMVPVLIIGLD